MPFKHHAGTSDPVSYNRRGVPLAAEGGADLLQQLEHFNTALLYSHSNQDVSGKIFLVMYRETKQKYNEPSVKYLFFLS